MNKTNIFLRGVDSHSLSAIYYWPEEARTFVGDVEDKEKAAHTLKKLSADNKAAEDFRGRGKPISFGLAYGCYPPKVASAARMPLVEAEAVFNAYHHEMYPGITDYRENYVLKTAQEQGYIHLGLGFRMYTDNPVNDIRTLHNGTCQFWSILTALAISRIHQMICKAGYENDIFVTSTIYDSIYFVVRDDVEIIQWVNNTIVPIMQKDFMENQTVKNIADLEIGPSWEELYILPQDADIKTITEVRHKWP